MQYSQTPKKRAAGSVFKKKVIFKKLTISLCSSGFRAIICAVIGRVGRLESQKKHQDTFDEVIGRVGRLESFSLTRTLCLKITGRVGRILTFTNPQYNRYTFCSKLN